MSEQVARERGLGRGMRVDERGDKRWWGGAEFKGSSKDPAPEAKAHDPS